jgi:hypothetical protein
MIRIRIAVLALATGMSPALAAPIEVALVENVMGAPGGGEAHGLCRDRKDYPARFQ